MNYIHVCAFGSCSLVCKFIDHVFDLIYELATRESDQYFIQCNGWPGRLVMQSVCFVFNSISFEQIRLVMRHLWVDIEDTGHSTNWPAVRIILPAWPDHLVESSVQIALPAREKHPAENINKTPCRHEKLPWRIPYKPFTKFLFVFFILQTQAWVSNALCSIVLPPRGTMGCYAWGVSWSVEYGCWI